MAVALYQQGIYTFADLRPFDFENEFENKFSSNAGTTAGTDFYIIKRIKIYIRWLMLWNIYRDDNSVNDPK